MKTRIFAATLCGIMVSFSLFAQQDNAALYKQGMKLKNEYQNKEALPIFQKLLKSDSNNVKYEEYTSYLYTKVGHDLATPQERMNYYKIGAYLAQKAIKLDSNSADAHYAYALALGRINENASNKQKVASAKLIKSEVDKTLKLDPKHAGAYHILGRWCRAIANFNFVEKAAISALYGGLPSATYEDAVKAFQKSIVYDPTYILHQYELAKTYHEMGKDTEAKVWLQHALTLPANNPDAKEAKKKCEDLLKEIED